MSTLGCDQHKMKEHRLFKSSIDAGNRSSIFVSPSHDKRNLWWKAFRKTVLDPHGITILDVPFTSKIPESLLGLVEDKCQSLERHESQALAFVEAVSLGHGFGVSPIFPPDILPTLDGRPSLSRCLQPALDEQTLPPPKNPDQELLFGLPVPRPGLVCGFSPDAFDDARFKEIPTYLTSTGCANDFETGQVHPGRAVYSPFFLFERTYGHAKHEIESAMNYCAMDGSAALNSIKLLYERAWPDQPQRPVADPIVFSCALDNDLGIIIHHWISESGDYCAAPLCKFDFRDLEHFMHFLAWVEAIEDWAAQTLLKDIQTALNAIRKRRDDGEFAKALPSSVTDAEKQEKLSRSMRTAFDNIPWKGERLRNTPLGVTGAMRMRSPKGQAEPEIVVTPMELNIPGDSTAKEINDVVSEQHPPVEKESAPKLRPSPISLNAPEKQPSHEPDSAKNPSSAATALSPPPPIPASLPTGDRKSSSSAAAHTRSNTPIASPPFSTTSVKSRTETSPAPAVTFGEPDKPHPVPKPVSIMDAIPPPRPASTKSPGVTSPSGSFPSMHSKRSFVSLRSRDRDKDRRLRSPAGSESAISPRSIGSGASSGGGLKSKFTNGFGIIREHKLSKRNGKDSSAPNSATDAPLPTPAYDKKRFEIRPPMASPPRATYPIAEERENAGVNEADPNGTVTSTATKVEPKIEKRAPLNPGTRSKVTEIYNATHVLPLRKWAKSPTVAITQTTTITAGGWS